MSNSIWSVIETFSNGVDYALARDEYFKGLENPDLAAGLTLIAFIHVDGAEVEENPTIGYGYNLVGKSLAQNTAFFTHAFGVALTPTQTAALQLLEDWRSETPVLLNGVLRVLKNPEIIDGAAGIIPELVSLDSLKLTDAQASAMLTAYLEGRWILSHGNDVRAKGIEQ